MDYKQECTFCLRKQLQNKNSTTQDCNTYKGYISKRTERQQTGEKLKYATISRYRYLWRTFIYLIFTRFPNTILDFLLLLSRLLYNSNTVSFKRTFLKSVFLLFGLILLADISSSEEVLKKDFKLMDSHVSVGTLFAYKLPYSLFDCSVDRLEVSEGSTRSLPFWLAYSRVKQELYGLPSLKDTGVYDILVVALTNSSTGTGRLCGMKAFSIKVVDSTSVPTINSPLSSVTVAALSSQIPENHFQCSSGLQAVFATVLFSADLYQLSGHQRTMALTSVADQFNIPANKMGLFTAANGHPLLSQLHQVSVLSSGAGNGRFKPGSKSLITWVINCGAIKLSNSYLTELESKIQDQTLSEVIGYPIVGWHITTGVQKSRHRARRAVAATPTPTATSALPTRVLNSSTIIIIGKTSSLSRSSFIVSSSTILPHSSTYSTPISSTSSMDYSMNVSSSTFVAASSVFELTSTPAMSSFMTTTITQPMPSTVTENFTSHIDSSVQSTSYFPSPASSYTVNGTISMDTSSSMLSINASTTSTLQNATLDRLNSSTVGYETGSISITPSTLILPSITTQNSTILSSKYLQTSSMSVLPSITSYMPATFVSTLSSSTALNETDSLGHINSTLSEIGSSTISAIQTSSIGLNTSSSMIPSSAISSSVASIITSTVIMSSSAEFSNVSTVISTSPVNMTATAVSSSVASSVISTSPVNMTSTLMSSSKVFLDTASVVSTSPVNITSTVVSSSVMHSNISSVISTSSINMTSSEVSLHKSSVVSTSPVNMTLRSVLSSVASSVISTRPVNMTSTLSSSEVSLGTSSVISASPVNMTSTSVLSSVATSVISTSPVNMTSPLMSSSEVFLGTSSVISSSPLNISLVSTASQTSSVVSLLSTVPVVTSINISSMISHTVMITSLIEGLSTAVLSSSQSSYEMTSSAFIDMSSVVLKSSVVVETPYATSGIVSMVTTPVSAAANITTEVASPSLDSSASYTTSYDMKTSFSTLTHRSSSLLLQTSTTTSSVFSSFMPSSSAVQDSSSLPSSSVTLLTATTGETSISVSSSLTRSITTIIPSLSSLPSSSVTLLTAASVETSIVASSSSKRNITTITPSLSSYSSDMLSWSSLPLISFVSSMASSALLSSQFVRTTSSIYSTLPPTTVAGASNSTIMATSVEGTSASVILSTSSSASFSSSLESTSVPTPSLSTTGSVSSSISSIGTTSTSSSTMASSSLPTSSVIIPTTKPNSPPELKNDIGRIQATAGVIFTYTIPEDTFNDIEDGNTRQLKLTLKQVVEGQPQDIPASFWLSFDGVNQRITGLPMESDIPDPADPQTGLKFRLTASDSQGAVAYDVFEILIGTTSSSPYTQSLSVTFDNDFTSFSNNLTQRLDLLSKISSYYNDPDTSQIRVISYKQGSVVLTWTNNSLPTNECDQTKLNDVSEKVVNDNGVDNGFKEYLSPEYIATGAERTLSGACIENATTSAPYISAKNVATEPSDLWEKHVIPGIVVAIILVILAILLICFIRRRRAKPSDPERRTYTKRKPIILDPEMEMKPIPNKPLILENDSPLSHPPSYMSEPSLYKSPYGSYDNGSGDFDEEDNRLTPPKQSPMYETPPPSYAQPEELAEPPPPPYMLPPTLLYPRYTLPPWEESSEV